jgi:hypothetical protein
MCAHNRPPFHKSGHIGWLAIAAGVIAWDAMGPETLTDAFRHVREHPAGSIAVGVAWGILTAHLFGWLPPKADPIHASTAYVRARKHALPTVRSNHQSGC